MASREKIIKIYKTALAEADFSGYSLTTHKKEKARACVMDMENVNLIECIRDSSPKVPGERLTEGYFPTAEEIALSFYPEDPVHKYLECIGHLKILPEEEEQALVKQAALGDEAALERLLDHSLLRVAAIAREYLNRGMVGLDLLYEGNEALVQAARDYDPDSIYPFGAYAAWKIRRAMVWTLENVICVRLNPNGPARQTAPRDQDMVRNPAMLRWLLERHNGGPIEEEDWMILAARFFPCGHRVLNLEETSVMMGISRDDVRIAEYRTIRRRRLRRAKRIRDFYNGPEPQKPEGQE